MKAKKWIAVCMIFFLMAGLLPQTPTYAADLQTQEETMQASESEPKPQEEAAAPETQEEEAAPETQEEAAAPETQEEAAAPETQEEAAAPETQEEAAAPKTQEEAAALVKKAAAHPEPAAYLSSIKVYRSMTKTGEQPLIRHEELDEEFGGKVYMVDYGSTSTSNNLFVDAELADDAPANTEIVLSAYNLDGVERSVQMKGSTDTKVTCSKISNTMIFGSGANGAKRAVYTVTAGVGEEKEVYKIIVNRVAELSDLKCWTEDELNSILTDKFDRTTRSYNGSISAEEDTIRVRATQNMNSTFDMKLNGITYESGSLAELPAQEDETTIRIELSKTDSYMGEPYEGKTYETTGSYVVTVKKARSVDVMFRTNPEDTIVCVYDNKGNRVEPSDGNEHLFKGLLEGEAYTYSATCHGYKGVKGSFTALGAQEIEVALESVDHKHEELTNNEWWNYRNNEENNGVTSVSTPEKADETAEKWAIQLGGEWSSSFTPPLILGGYLYTAANKFVYKLDKDTGEVLDVSEELAGSVGFALNSLTYGEGMIFVQVGNGQIQALDARSLESAWISEPLGGQTLSPIAYKNGYIYTGTWNSETDPGIYFCLSVTDEDPEDKYETKYCSWKYSHKGGFYWAGAYASEKYMVFGSDDGTKEGNHTNNSILYSVSSKTGILIDKLEGLHGDIRTSVVYAGGYIYVATKGGYLYRVKMREDGKFGEKVSYHLGGMATASPVVYNGRIYIGVCGQGGQFNADGGHHFAVLQENAKGISEAYTVPIGGYPQAGALLSTAYEVVDYTGDGAADGKVYVYLTYNAFPGGIMGFTDAPGQTSATLETYYEPEAGKQQYCISPLCVDSDGTIYYKNDSNYLISVESNSAYLNGIKAKSSVGEVSWDAEFRRTRMEYKLKVEQGTRQVKLTLDIPKGRSVTINGEACTGRYTLKLADGKGTAEIVVTHNNKKKKYILMVEELDGNTLLQSLVVSSSNNFNREADRIDLTPAFSPMQQNYSAGDYDNPGAFLNLFAMPENGNASMKLTAVSGVKKITRVNNASGSAGHTRFSVYFEDQEARAVVDLTVTAANGKDTFTYRVTLMRTDVYPPILTNAAITRINAEEAFITFDANEAGSFCYQIADPGKAVSDTMESLPAVSMQEGANRIELRDLAGKGKTLYIYATDVLGNTASEPYQISLKAYKRYEAIFETVPQDAEIQLRDALGNEIVCKNGACFLIDGNTYYAVVSAPGYETMNVVITADATDPKHSFTLTSIRSANADLKQLMISSSDKPDAGLLKLSPGFHKDVTNYTAGYGKERTHLNLWAEAEDSNAAISVYAVSGVKGSTVNKDETISETMLAEGERCWRICFGKNAVQAKVRVQVEAEDGTAKNYFVTLSIEDATAPVLSRVSASRISGEQASVVFKTSEAGTYYYEMAKKDAGVPVMERESGKDILEGTETISLDGLDSGSWDIYIIQMDAAGNESNLLKMEIPDAKTAAAVGLMQGATGDGGIRTDHLTGQLSVKSGGLSGQSSTALKMMSVKDGDRSDLKQQGTDQQSGGQHQNKTPLSGMLDALGIAAEGQVDPVKLALLIAAAMGLCYLMFHRYSVYWYKQKRQKIQA